LHNTSAPIFYKRINHKFHNGFDMMGSTERVELNDTTDEIFVAYVMVVGADTHRFGRMIERPENAYSVGTNNYPSPSPMPSSSSKGRRIATKG
jgi:hypothetical protein